jgi:hypothetical protein
MLVGDIGEAGGRRFIVLEVITEGSLKGLLKVRFEDKPGGWGGVVGYVSAKQVRKIDG